LVYQILPVANKDDHRPKCPCMPANADWIRSMTGTTRSG
jgi:hypothetical protein